MTFAVDLSLRVFQLKGSHFFLNKGFLICLTFSKRLQILIAPKNAPFVQSSPEALSSALFCCQDLYQCNSWVREPKRNEIKPSINAQGSNVNLHVEHGPRWPEAW